MKSGKASAKILIEQYKTKDVHGILTGSGSP